MTRPDVRFLAPMARRAAVACLSAVPRGAALLGLIAFSSPAMASDYYVASDSGSDSYDGSSATHTTDNIGPWATITRGCSSKPGDTVHVMPGTYVSKQGAGIGCSSSGAAGAPITFTGTGTFPNQTKITNDGSDFTVMILGSYQTWSNFEMTSDAPVGGPDNVNSGNSWDCIFSTPGGTVKDPAKAPLRNLTITGNTLHGCGGNGIDLFNSDYIEIFGNTIYNNAHSTTQAYASGITILGAADADSSTDYKVIIDSNYVYNNTNVPNCAGTDSKCLNAAGDTDGNGIILDSSDLRYDNYPGGVYPGIYGPSYHGRTLVKNNLVYGNGGKCIHAYRTKHVDIMNNTCWNNLQDPYYGAGVSAEIDSSGGFASMLDAEPDLRTKLGLTTPASDAGDEIVYNNSITNSGVADSKTEAPACVAFSYTNEASHALNNQCYSLHGTSATASYDKYNASGVTNEIDPTLASSLYVSADLVSPSLNPATANFKPMPNSPLIAGSKNSLRFVHNDITGAARSTSAMTLGAYEH